MQSRTSFFNGSIFRKSVTRFWPIWGGYFAIWFLMIPVVLLSIFIKKYLVNGLTFGAVK